jgi:hypothetical protein
MKNDTLIGNNHTKWTRVTYIPNDQLAQGAKHMSVFQKP